MGSTGLALLRSAAIVAIALALVAPMGLARATYVDSTTADGTFDTAQWSVYDGLAAGRKHTCVVKGDGSVWCWGRNNRGQLGDGSTTDSPTPVQVVGLAGIVQVGAGENHTCAIRDDGTLWCWGWNSAGQLGDGTRTNSPVPVQVTGTVDVVAVDGGIRHTCALESSGTAWCWGRNNIGQLGDGTTGNSTTPVPVTGVSTGRRIAVGLNHSCVHLTDGSVRCWGSNSWGQLGDGTTSNSTTPVPATGVSAASDIDGGDFHTCAVESDGDAFCWGNNNRGQLGDGTTNSSSTPVSVVGPGGTGVLTDATAIALGARHSCAGLAGGTVVCWGLNDRGQLGDGTSITSRPPVAVVGVGGIGFLDEAGLVTAGRKHTCAGLTTTVGCWGLNDSGQLGDGTTSDSSTPVLVAGL